MRQGLQAGEHVEAWRCGRPVRDLRGLDLDCRDADFSEGPQDPPLIVAIFRNVQQRDRVRGLCGHAGKDPAGIVDVRERAECAAHDHLPWDSRVELGEEAGTESSVRHGPPCLGNQRGIGIQPTDDIAVVVEGNEKLAGATSNLEELGARADIQGFSNVLSEFRQAGYFLSSDAMSMVAVSICTEPTFVPAGTRKGNEHLYSGCEPGSMMATDVL